jgi:hypothetical protein
VKGRGEEGRGGKGRGGKGRGGKGRGGKGREREEGRAGPPILEKSATPLIVKCNVL